MRQGSVGGGAPALVSPVSRVSTGSHHSQQGYGNSRGGYGGGRGYEDSRDHYGSSNRGGYQVRLIFSPHFVISVFSRTTVVLDSTRDSMIVEEDTETITEEEEAEEGGVDMMIGSSREGDTVRLKSDCTRDL